MILFILVSCSAPGDTHRGDTAQWRVLFDGHSLDGWRVINGTATFEVQDSQIIGKTAFGTPNTFLATNEIFDDFILEFEVQVDSVLNSGVQFRSNSTADYQNGRVHGYQCEIDPSARKWSGGIYDEGRRGWLYDLAGYDAGRKAFRQDAWNAFRIEAIGDTLRTWVNQINTANLVDTVTARGFIALQVHSIADSTLAGKEIRWRNMRILTSNPVHHTWRNRVQAPLEVLD